MTLPDRQAAVARRLPRCVVWVPADVTAHVGVAQRAGRAPSRACDGGRRAAGDQAGTGASEISDAPGISGAIPGLW